MVLIITRIKQLLLEEDELKIRYSLVDSSAHKISGYTQFNEVAKRYINNGQGKNEENMHKVSTVRDLEYFLKSVPQEYFRGEILDVGCGDGSYSLLTKSKLSRFFGMKYTGCEISEDIITASKKIFPNLNIFKSKVEDIDAESGKYEVVLCSGTIQYTMKNWKISLKELVRVANGLLIISRLPLTRYGNNFDVKQEVLSKRSYECQYFRVINQLEFEEATKVVGLKIISKEATTEIYNIEGVNEPILTYQYCFCMSKNP